jgi:hypothetical protein
MGPEEEVRPMLGLFKCSWLNVRASLTGGCGIRTFGLGVRMRLKGPEEVGLVGVFASGASLSDAASPSKDGGEGAEDGGKGGYSGAKQDRHPLRVPSSFLGFSLHLEAAATLAIMMLHASSRQGLSHVG